MEYDYIVFTDGSAKKKGDYLFNGGSAVVLLDTSSNKIFKKGKSLPDRTSNYSELYAVLMALEMINSIKKKKKKVKIMLISDSKYVIGTFTKWAYTWSKGKKKDDEWERKSGTIQNETLIKHIFYEYVMNENFNISFIHMNSHKTYSSSDINEMKRKIKNQGYDINADTIKVFIKYNDIADKISYKYSSDA